MQTQIQRVPHFSVLGQASAVADEPMSHGCTLASMLQTKVDA